MKVYSYLNPDKKPKYTDTQLAMLEALKEIEPEPDKENPELTEEELAQMRSFAELRREQRQKQVLTIRVTQETMRKAKALGKGYTGILSRLLELALNDPEMVKKAL